MRQLRRLLLQPSSPLRVLSAKYSLQKRPCFSNFSASSESQISDTHSTEHLDDEPATAASTTISIDRSGLYNPPKHLQISDSDSELVKQLKTLIKSRGGPISVADYMNEVLTNPKAGFYMNRDVFGAEGDFITSPEVSQMFGEMVGVWAMSLWEQMGQPNRVNLVELGPGRGTLMVDLLRVASKFKNFTDSLRIHLVECSPTLQKLQHYNLKCVEEDNTGENVEKRTISTIAGTPVSWHPKLDQVPTGTPTIIVAHEFFDALPVCQFQRTPDGWFEKKVDVAEDSSFHFVLPKEPSKMSLFLMRRFHWSTPEELAKVQQIEVSLMSMVWASMIAKRIGEDGGGALIIDYGLNGIVSDSLQAIRKHKFVDIFDNPGSADLSAYVDFVSVKRSAEDASEDVSVYGPITQSQLLGSLGISVRLEALLQNCTEEQAESLKTGYWRLVGDGKDPSWEGPDEQAPIGMGTRYLALAIVKKDQGVPVPFEENKNEGDPVASDSEK